MAARKEWVVRVVTTIPERREVLEPEVDEALLECLRYAGAVDVHRTSTDDGLTYQCFDIIAPKGTDSKRWAEMNARRMCTFGFNAAAAPRTSERYTSELPAGDEGPSEAARARMAEVRRLVDEMVDEYMREAGHQDGDEWSLQHATSLDVLSDLGLYITHHHKGQ